MNIEVELRNINDRLSALERRNPPVVSTIMVDFAELETLVRAAREAAFEFGDALDSGCPLDLLREALKPFHGIE